MEHIIPGWMLVPFAAMLLSIAILPLMSKTNEWWENNWNKLLVSFLLGVPTAAWLCLHNMSHEIVHQMVYDYVPFILLLMALFVTTGGICIQGDLRATPHVTPGSAIPGILQARTLERVAISFSNA